MGSPIKRPLSRGKTYPKQEKIIFLNSLLQSYRHPHHCRNFYRFAVSAFTAPVTHQDEGLWGFRTTLQCGFFLIRNVVLKGRGKEWIRRPEPLRFKQKRKNGL
jgi:hypothetical protein